MSASVSFFKMLRRSGTKLSLSMRSSHTTELILLLVCGLCWCRGCLDEERRLLLHIKDSLSHPHGATRLGLWEGEDCCEWVGVSCQSPSNSSRVVWIDLGHKREEGLGTWFPNASLFAQFKALEWLFLSGNQIGGWVMPHEFAQMKSLKKLFLSENRLNESIESLSGFCGLRNLRILDISSNNLNSIPACLLRNLSLLEDFYISGNNLQSSEGFNQIRSLRNLDLTQNKLNASINSLDGLCGLENLRVLHLDSNGLGDENLPPCLLSTVPALENLNLASNKLQGHFGVATGLCKMKNIAMLDLRDNNLDDQSILPCLSNISSLQKLILSQNHLGRKFGITSGLQGLTNLQTLHLDANHLTDEDIVPWISNLTSLTFLSLAQNDLRNSTSLTGLCNLRNLNDLSLMENLVQGKIPVCFKDMYSLQHLEIYSNQFSGTIPASIFSNLTMIETFIAMFNQFDGVISFSMFANLSQLLIIDLSNNPQLEIQTTHPHWIPKFQLSVLHLSGCNLGRQNIPRFLATQNRLFSFESAYSSLEGTIPPWLLYNTTSPKSISLRSNMLTGPFPQSSMENLSMLMELDISDNNVHGPLPRNIGTLLPYLRYINFSMNYLQGKVPASMGKLMMLETLDLSNNNFSGEMPQTLTRNNPSLKFLSLASNNLEGEIFARDSNMTELLVLILHSNHFSGTIPASLLNVPSLMFLDIRKNNVSGPIPSWFPSLPNMVSLLFGSNHLEGPIPTQLCQMQNLHTLDLSKNSISGSIPSCLNRITSWVESSPIKVQEIYQDSLQLAPPVAVKPWQNIRVTVLFTTKGTAHTYEGGPLTLMTGLDLSENRLTGDIPSQLGNLRELHALNLSNNLLTGPLPDSFPSLKNMESLDLSHNKLVGPIPPQLVQLSFLSTFNVAFNDLSGSVPTGGQFHTFPKSSYIGNIGLCGQPPERSCSSVSPPPQPDEGDEEASRIIDKPVFFYLWVAISFGLGFWTFIFVLLFNKNWRWKYFIAADACIRSISNGIWRCSLLVKNHCPGQ